MKAIVAELIQTFYDSAFPELELRNLEIPERERNATVMTGMRRTGKTFLAFQRIQELLKKNNLDLNRILYMNFEDDRLFGFSVEDFRLIPDLYFQFFPENMNKMCYFFLDEIQNIPEWELFVRRLIDTGRIQVYLTGSSSKLLTSEIATSMRGRSLEVEVFPFSFEEFLKRHNILNEIPNIIAGSNKVKVKNALDEYFKIGGFPEVQGATPQQWLSILQGYSRSVMLKDVAERHKILNTDALKYIMHRIFHNTSQKLSIRSIYDELKKLDMGVDRNYIKSYLDYFCDAYIFYPVSYKTDSLAQKRNNPDKYYAIDIGLVRAMSSKQSQDKGYLLENLVFLHLRRKGYKIEYLVTRNGYEIDFIAYHPLEREYKIIQVSYTLKDEDTFEREIRALKDVIDYVHSQECLIVTWDEEAELEHGIKAVPAWKFLLDRY